MNNSRLLWERSSVENRVIPLLTQFHTHHSHWFEYHGQQSVADTERWPQVGLLKLPQSTVGEAETGDGRWVKGSIAELELQRSGSTSWKTADANWPSCGNVSSSIGRLFRLTSWCSNLIRCKELRYDIQMKTVQYQASFAEKREGFIFKID